MTNTLKTILASIIGGVIFLVFLIVLKADFIIALVVGVLGVFGSFFLLPATHNQRAAELEKKQKQSINEKLVNGKNKIAVVKYYSQNIDDRAMKDKLKKICDSGEWIVNYLRKNPEDIQTSNKFLNYYLDTTLNIVKKFQALEKGKGFTQEQLAQLDKAKKVIDTIGESFEKQVSKIVEDDFMDLSVEMEVLEKTLKSEGMLDE
jgi:5-bromo-4-chloroindolyl phosphate hydrolysis protein